MNYAYIPKALLYKQKSLDKLAMQHPLNAKIIKRLLKMDGWNKNYSRDHDIFACLNNAYYICTIMRLEFDPTFHEISYQGIARQGSIEGNNTFLESVTLSLVSLLIEHSTQEWQQKLKEVADDLRRYAKGLIDEREESVLGFPDVKMTKVVELLGVYKYLSKDIDDTWVLPDDFFQPRIIDNHAILDLYRQDPTFNWDKRLWRMGEDDFHELIEALGKTQLEKALLIHSFWKDVYKARKQFDGPIKETWIFLRSLAQEFCPDYMETTELHKIPGSGVEFEKRISELEEDVNKLKKENDELKKQLQELLDTDEDNDEEEDDYEEDENDEDEVEGNYEECDEAPKIFDSRINEDAVINKMKSLDSEKVPGMRRWYVFYRVFDFLEWLKQPTHRKFISWVQHHFGWRWKKRDFKGVPSKLKKKPNEWKKIVLITKSGKKNKNIGPDYYAFADDIVKAFVEIDDKGMHDKEDFLLDKNKAINHHNEW